jgi:tetratricopeptide (TPR) repeat protein
MNRVLGSLFQRLTALTLLVTVSACSNLPAGLSDFLSPNGDSSGNLSTKINVNANTDNLYRVHLRVGRTALQNADYITAIYFLERAHGADKTRVAPLLYMGKVYLSLKSDDRAEAAFRKILTLDKDHVESHREVAELLIKKAKYKESLFHLETALKIAPSVDLHNRAGVVYDLLGNRAKAQSHYRAGLDIDPGNTGLQDNLKLSRLKDVSSSRTKSEQVSGATQVSPGIPFNLGSVRSRETKNQTALASLPKKRDHIVQRNTETKNIKKNRALTKPYMAKLIPHRDMKSISSPIPESSTPLPTKAETRFSVQLAAYNNIATARRGLNKLAGWLGNEDLGLRVVKRKQATGFVGNVNFRIRTLSWPDRARAVAICARIKNRDGSCIVVKQRPGLWEPISAPETQTAARTRQPNEYRIQFGAYPDIVTITRGLQFLDRKAGGSALDFKIMVRVAPIAMSATNYRIRSTPFSTSKAAQAACDAVRGKGVECLVIRHNNAMWRSPG